MELGGGGGGDDMRVCSEERGGGVLEALRCSSYWLKDMETSHKHTIAPQPHPL